MKPIDSVIFYRRVERYAPLLMRRVKPYELPSCRRGVDIALAWHRRRPLHLRTWVFGGLRALVFFHAWFLGLVIVLSLLYRFVDPPITSFMVYRATYDGQAIKSNIFIPLNQIPQSMRRAFLRLEDHNFYQHHGFSLGAIREAFERNVQYGDVVYGGSTISQQLARNLFLNPDRNVVRKYLEFLAVIPMDFILGKDRVLELYMNTVELGPGAFGVGRGAWVQYQRSFYKLSNDERLRLVVIVASPLRYTVHNFAVRRLLAARYQAIAQ